MDDLTKALDNYKIAFQKKLDSYQTLELDIPTLNDVGKTKRAEDHHTPPSPSKTKKPIFEPLEDFDLAQGTLSQTTTQKTAQTTSLSEAKSPPLEPLPKIPTPIFPEPRHTHSPPLPSPLIIKPRHIIHRAVQSFGFRFSFGLILLLLL